MIGYATDVGVCWLVMAVTLVQSSDALSANCTISGSRESNRCSAASGSRTLERAGDLFMFVPLPQNSAVTLLAELIRTDKINSSELNQNVNTLFLVFTKKQINEIHKNIHLKDY